MDTCDVVVHEVESATAALWFSSFFEKVLVKASEPPHLHPHREVLPLDVGSRDMRRSGLPVIRCSRAPAHSAVARLGAVLPRLPAVQLEEPGVVNVGAERECLRLNRP